MSARRIFARPARFSAIAPYLWMLLFFLVPFGFVLKISLSQTAIAQPPYVPLFDLTEVLRRSRRRSLRYHQTISSCSSPMTFIFCPICAASSSRSPRPRSCS